MHADWAERAVEILLARGLVTPSAASQCAAALRSLQHRREEVAALLVEETGLPAPQAAELLELSPQVAETFIEETRLRQASPSAGEQAGSPAAELLSAGESIELNRLRSILASSRDAPGRHEVPGPDQAEATTHGTGQDIAGGSGKVPPSHGET